MHMHKRNKGRGSQAFLQQVKSLFRKVGVAHEANIAAAAFIVLPYLAFLISQLT